MTRYLSFIGTAVVLLILFFLSAWITIWWATSGKSIAVPDLQGKDVVDALKEVGKIGLDLRVVREEFHPEVPRNGVITQRPKPGTELKADRNIEVVLSLGERDIAIPDVRGVSLRKAELMLRQNGLSLGRTTRIYSQEEEGAILSQNPIPPALNLQKSSIDLLVSRGPKAPEYRMPDLIGIEFAKAEALLETSDLAIGNVRYEAYAGVEGNRVINQSPLYGYPVSKERPIALVVHKRPDSPPGATVTRVAFSYRIPFGFLPVETDVFVEDGQGRRRIFTGRKFPGSRLELTLELSGEAVVEVYLKGEKVHTREYR